MPSRRSERPCLGVTGCHGFAGNTVIFASGMRPRGATFDLRDVTASIEDFTTKSQYKADQRVDTISTNTTED